MIALSHKSKHYGLIALKVLILSYTFIYLYRKLVLNPEVSWQSILEVVTQKQGSWLLLFLGMAMINWGLEIKKWQLLVSSLDPIDLKTSMKQCLSAFTISILTPMRIGDYAGKTIYFPREQTNHVLRRNFLGNAAQMLVTLVLGVIGMIFLILQNELPLSLNLELYLLIAGLLVLGISILAFRGEWIKKSVLIKPLIREIRLLGPTVLTWVLILSILRYLCFSILFYGILVFFNAEIGLAAVIPLICSMYLLVSIAPTILILDVVVRGGIAVWLFSFAQVPEVIVLSTVFLMYLLNFAIPALVGSWHVFHYSIARK